MPDRLCIMNVVQSKGRCALIITQDVVDVNLQPPRLTVTPFVWVSRDQGHAYNGF